MKQLEDLGSMIISESWLGNGSILRRVQKAFALERRGRASKTCSQKAINPEVEEDLLAEVQRLRAENDYLKNLQALVLKNERRQQKKRR